MGLFSELQIDHFVKGAARHIGSPSNGLSYRLELIAALTHRGGARIGGSGHPYSETSRDHSGGNGKQGDLAHLSSPVIEPFQFMLNAKGLPTGELVDYTFVIR